MTRVRRLVSLAALMAAIAVGAAGCHKSVPPAAPTQPAPPPVAAPPPPPPPQQPPPPPPPAPRAPTEQEVFSRKSLDDLSREMSDVFFDYDKAEIRDDGREPLQRDGDWLKKWPTTQITIEGHCDSRGSSQYNLGLGSRRATAVRDYLVNLGVPPSRITVVSKGKEQPFCTEETESCWQQNRRGHFIVTSK